MVILLVAIIIALLVVNGILLIHLSDKRSVEAKEMLGSVDYMELDGARNRELTVRVLRDTRNILAVIAHAAERASSAPL